MSHGILFKQVIENLKTYKYFGIEVLEALKVASGRKRNTRIPLSLHHSCVLLRLSISLRRVSSTFTCFSSRAVCPATSGLPRVPTPSSTQTHTSTASRTAMASLPALRSLRMNPKQTTATPTLSSHSARLRAEATHLKTREISQ